MCFPWAKQEKFTKSVHFVNLGDFCEFSLFLFSRQSTENSEKYPFFANRLAKRPLFGLVCRNDSWYRVHIGSAGSKLKNESYMSSRCLEGCKGHMNFRVFSGRFSFGPFPGLLHARSPKSDSKTVEIRELKNIYHHHHPESKKRKSPEGNSGSIQPYGRYGNAGKTNKSMSTIAILWPVKAIFEKSAATVEVDTFISSGNQPFFSPIFWLCFDRDLMAHVTCCFPHLPVVNQFLRFWPSQADRKWLKLTEADWNWLKLIKHDRKSIKMDWKSTRIRGKTIEIAKKCFGDFAWKVGQKIKHLAHVDREDMRLQSFNLCALFLSMNSLHCSVSVAI